MTWRVLLAVGLALLGCAPSAATAAMPPSSGQIVMYRNVDNPRAETRAHERALGFTATHRYRSAIEGFSARLTPNQVAQLRKDPNVAAIVPDSPVHADSSPLVPGGTLPAGITRIWAESAGSVRDVAGPAVAVIDTGIDLTNSDLNVTPGTNCLTNGPPQDDNGHGTHVAGTIGALNNGSGVVGVAPGTHLYAVKVLGAGGSGTLSTVICGLDWVAQNASALGIKVANMSLGGSGSIGPCPSDPEHGAVCRVVAAGVTVVAAAGNDGQSLAGHLPAAYPEVLTVTAMDDTDGQPGNDGPTCQGDPDDGAASFSNFGTLADASHIIAAPGGCVVSLAVGGGVRTMSGTSMATPHVAGAAALCIAEGATPGPCAGQSPAGVIATLRSVAEAGATSTNGFEGDPLNPISRYYGYLVRAAIPPTAATDPAGSVGDHDATLAGTISPGNAVSSWWFEYGDTTAYGQSTAAQTEGADPNPIAVQTAVSGIDSGTTYHYRVVMQTGEWTIRGADQTVATTGQAPPPPPDTQITLAPPQRTANNTAEIRFVATPATGAGFECRLDTATWSACTSPFVTTAGEGAHTFAVRATNGKPDLSPATTIWTVDTTPPDTFLAGTPAASTTDASAAFSFRSNEAPVTFECRLDGGPWSGCTSPNTVSGLSPGSHRFEVRATDAVGWVDQTPAASGWVVDSAAGSIPSSPFPDATSGVAGSPITTGPGAALLPVARVAVSGPVRLDRRRASVSLTLVCRGPGPCAGRLSVLLRGLNVAGTSFRIAAGARKSVTLKLGRQGRRVLRLRPPRTASLALTRAARTALERSATRLLTN